MAKDTTYYDTESEQYSQKRYPATAATYVQSFYLRRLEIVLKLVRMLSRAHPVSVLEIGCADGIVLRKLHEALPSASTSMEGIDVSPRMVEAARQLSRGLPISFSERSSEVLPRDLVLEIGVLNYVPDIEEEILRLRTAIAAGGHAIVSVAGTDSLWRRLKRTGGDFANFRSYREYERLMRRHFSIVISKPVGLFIPHLWKVPAVARILQPLAESLLAPLVPGLFHERVYLLAPFLRA